MKYRLGTRKSELARTQSTHVLEALKNLGIETELVLIESRGDQNSKEALYQIENMTPGLFTKQLEEALIQKEIDLAVHSLKDLPTEQPVELCVGAITSRFSTEDWLIIHPEAFDGAQPLFLQRSAHVGTSSLRREGQLLSARSDLKISPIRGNVPTRVNAIRDRRFDATVLAAAGLERLKFNLEGLHVVKLAEREFPPAPGQGALAVEIRRDASQELKEALKKIHHLESEIETRIERRVLKGLFGGCTLPLGIRCYREGNLFKTKVFIGVLKDRKSLYKDWLSFHHFDICCQDEETLVDSIIEKTKGFLNG
ncbi:MAG: hydroxymethylbilane synthase [Deltaproteobacteria bacterium]|nr:hydroxymethylbilane synthase [Deltaproteobacteria bacterium]